MPMRSDDLYLTSASVRSDPIWVLDTYETVFGLLTATTVREALNKAFQRNSSPEAYEIDKGVLLMARAIRTINDKPLILDAPEIDAVRKAMGLRPDQEFTAVMGAELILDERFTKRAVDAFEEAYTEWLVEYETAALEAVKKKLNPGAIGTPPSGSATPGTSSPTTPG